MLVYKTILRTCLSSLLNRINNKMVLNLIPDTSFIRSRQGWILIYWWTHTQRCFNKDKHSSVNCAKGVEGGSTMENPLFPRAWKLLHRTIYQPFLSCFPFFVLRSLYFSQSRFCSKSFSFSYCTTFVPYCDIVGGPVCYYLTTLNKCYVIG